MQLWSTLKRWLEPAQTAQARADERFSMGGRGGGTAEARTAPRLLSDAETLSEGVIRHIDSLLEASPQGKQALEKAGDLTSSLDDNLDHLKKLFRMPPNKDLVLREVRIPGEPPIRAVVCFMEGLVDKHVQNEHIVEPLISAPAPPASVADLKERILQGSQVTEKYDFKSVAESVLSGDTVVMVDSFSAALAVETKGFPTRNISEPKVEQSVWGPRDSFNEAWRMNVALVRRRLKDPRVVTEILTVGELGNTYLGVVYVDGIASPKLVAEVRRRVKALRIDAVEGAGTLEQFIEDSPGSLFPTTLNTERPDRTVAYLREGHVALFLDNSPQAIILPVTLWALLQTPEDYYLRHPFGSFLRFLRAAGLLIALLLPAVYIAIMNYHQEMVPTDLMLFIASTRETVPMPALAELVSMDLIFELIREAGIRIPNVIGPTIGLVASLVLGQAVVQARIVSPVMVIVVAITGLASFAVPNYLAGFGLRFWRFVLLAAAGFLGFFGIGAVLFVAGLHLASMRSFGVPYLAPIAPRDKRVADVLIRPQLFTLERRPSYMRTLNRRRQSRVVRPWDPNSPGKNPEGGKDS